MNRSRRQRAVFDGIVHYGDSVILNVPAVCRRLPRDHDANMANAKEPAETNRHRVNLECYRHNRCSVFIGLLGYDTQKGFGSNCHDRIFGWYAFLLLLSQDCRTRFRFRTVFSRYVPLNLCCRVPKNIGNKALDAEPQIGRL